MKFFFTMRMRLIILQWSRRRFSEKVFSGRAGRLRHPWGHPHRQPGLALRRLDRLDLITGNDEVKIMKELNWKKVTARKTQLNSCFKLAKREHHHHNNRYNWRKCRVTFLSCAKRRHVRRRRCIVVASSYQRQHPIQQHLNLLIHETLEKFRLGFL